MSAKDDLPTDPVNPWREVERREVYRNPWIAVEEHRVVTPSGDDGIYGVVRPSHLALGIVPVDAELCTWLVGQYRYTLNEYSWEIPEGGGDPDLDPQAEAARELLEETGLRAERWTPLMRLHTSNCFTDEVALVYLAEDLEAGPSEPEPTEKLRLHRLPLAEACERVHRGEITDAISAAALLRAAHVLGLRV